MVNVLDKDKILWYVMRAYKNENTAEDRLSNETYGLDMTNFIKVCKQADEEVHFYKISEINKEKDKINIEKGKRVRVHGGPFDQVEGYFIKVAKKRGRQLVVIIPDLLAVSAEVKPEYIQIID